jgi:dethiobiotin synthetase
MSGIFVTAIGTDCGKTHATAAVVRTMLERGDRVLALKPLMTGFDPEKLEASDAGRLLAAMGRSVSEDEVARINWKRLPEWSAPNVAARHAGMKLDFDDMSGFVSAAVRQFHGPVLVEGVGGVMSPLTDEKTNIDLAADLGWPVLLMASNYLGAVSHTLTALESLEKRRLAVRAIGVTQSLPNAGLAAPLVEELGRWTRRPIVECGFSRTPEDDARWAVGLASRLLA